MSVADYESKFEELSRWKKIYEDTDEVNKVQLAIRIGHAKTVEGVMKMLKDDGGLTGVTVCDAGCGTGCLSILLAKEGAVVSASDISAAMLSYELAEVLPGGFAPSVSVMVRSLWILLGFCDLEEWKDVKLGFQDAR
ncbi:magnesium protoporphyrin IX methyltransferase, chloroplastic-like [Apium graveolens]|uniref:magnesium protoporphyrin IX methyltransferase, chloroplastic-like n=1 Tax=Apium graveolens TaxID=4045 RepID=UPI003D7B3A32